MQGIFCSLPFFTSLELLLEEFFLILEGVTVLISHYSQDLLNGAVLDFVELNPGEFNFIFINPTDSEAVPSADGCATGGCGSCGSGGCH